MRSDPTIEKAAEAVLKGTSEYRVFYAEAGSGPYVQLLGPGGMLTLDLGRGPGGRDQADWEDLIRAKLAAALRSSEQTDEATKERPNDVLE